MTILINNFIVIKESAPIVFLAIRFTLNVSIDRNIRFNFETHLHEIVFQVIFRNRVNLLRPLCLEQILPEKGIGGQDIQGVTEDAEEEDHCHETATTTRMAVFTIVVQLCVVLSH